MEQSTRPLSMSIVIVEPVIEIPSIGHNIRQLVSQEDGDTMFASFDSSMPTTTVLHPNNIPSIPSQPIAD